MKTTNNRALWLKKVLIPFWVLDAAVLIFITWLGASDAWYTDKYRRYEDANSPQVGLNLEEKQYALSIAMAVISALFAIFTGVTAGLFFTSGLSPLVYLIGACLRVVAFFAIVIDQIHFGAMYHDWADIIYVAFTGAIFVSAIGQTIYGGVILSRARKGLASTGNAGFTGFEEEWVPKDDSNGVPLRDLAVPRQERDASPASALTNREHYNPTAAQESYSRQGV